VLVLAGKVVERPVLVQSTVLSRAAAGVLVRLLQALPSALVDALARAVAACAHGLGVRRRVTLDNLAHAFPERSAEECRVLARAAYANMARVVVDALRTLGASRAQLLAAVQVDDFGPVERALAAGKGLLVATAHLGSWELFGAAMAQRVPLHAVVRPLRGGVNARLVEARERAGLRLIPARGALSGMAAALRRNEVVAMLVDRWGETDGVPSAFLGGKHFLPRGPFALSLATGAPILPAFVVRDGANYRSIAERPFVVEGDEFGPYAARLSQVLEGVIRRYPDQWYNFVAV
jgi:KDO2-lipid IV(A) lauroyltransferase